MHIRPIMQLIINHKFKTMYKIQTNQTGSREMLITDAHLRTIENRALFKDLVDSTGIVNEEVLEKLRMNVRALLENETDAHDLIVFSHEVLFHDNMKAFGLNQLIKLYRNWQETKSEIEKASFDDPSIH